MADQKKTGIERHKEQIEMWQELSKAHWSHWRAWGSWFSWGFTSWAGAVLCAGSLCRRHPHMGY